MTPCDWKVLTLDTTGNAAARPHTASVEDVADHFGVHSNTVYNWLKSDNPPPHRRVGHLYRFNIGDVDRWADARSEEVA